MRLLLWLLAVSCWLSAARAQWLEATVPLPDSFGGMRNPSAFVVNTGNNTVFVGGTADCLWVLDGVTNRKIARIPVSGSADAMCYNPTLNKVYCVNSSRPYVYVIDAAANRLIDSVPVPTDPRAICYAPQVNRVYCGGASLYLAAIDCDADTITGVTMCRLDPVRLVAAPSENKVYCGLERGFEDEIAVLDCAGDSIIRTIHIVDIDIDDVAYNPAANKLYVSYCAFGTVIIIDCASDSVLSWTNVGEGNGALAVSPTQNRVYVSCSNDDRVDVISGTTNNVVATIDSVSGLLTHDAQDDILFCASSGWLVAVNCADDSILGSVWTGGTARVLCWSPSNNRVYVGADDIAVVDAVARQVVARIPESWFDIRQVCWCALDNELYACSTDSIAVMELPANRVKKRLEVPAGIGPVFYQAAGDKLYTAAGFSVRVLDCATDSVVKVISVGLTLEAFCYDRVDAKLYGSSRDDLVVMSCITDSVVAQLSLGLGDITDLVHSPAVNRLYCAIDDNTVAVVDCVGDSVIGGLPVTPDEHTLCYIPDGDLVACANSRTGSVQVASCSTGQVLQTIPVLEYPSLMAYSNRSRRLYCYCSWSSNRRIVVIDVPTLSPIDTIHLPARAIAASYDSLADRVAWAASNPPQIVFIQCGSDSIVATVPVPGYPASIVRGADRRLYVANRDASSYSVIRDTTTVGTSETMNDERGMMSANPTIVRSLLFLPEAVGGKRLAAGTHLLDATGRKVADLHAGANDVRTLAPGVYFVREARARAQAVRKVIVTR